VNPAANQYLLDTNIISDLMRDPQGRAAQQVISINRANSQTRFLTSVIVDCELRYGLARKPQARLQAAYEATLQTLTVLPLDLEVAQTYAQMRHAMTSNGLGLDTNDTLIAAQALSLGAILVSADAAFSRVPGLQVENWLAPEAPQPQSQALATTQKLENQWN
jgi:tRNA(fMet)-specific endonuclease VapC